MRDAVIKIAQGELGNTENPPGSNRVKYWDTFGAGWQGQPWCVCFLWWVFHHAGEDSAFFGGAKTASCGTLYRWYKEQGLTVQKDEVQAGNILLLNFHGGTQPEHCGIVESVIHGPILQVVTIEGNTSPGLEGSQDNGGCVARKIRYRSQIVGVCRPTYKEDKPVIDETDIYGDYSGHWAEKDIRRAMELGLVKGYPDGTFQPDKPITRAEAAVMLLRLYDKLLGVAQ